MKLVLAAVAAVLLIAPAVAQAGVVTTSGSVLTYTGDAAEDDLQFRREANNDITISTPGLTTITEDSADCTLSSNVVTCAGLGTNLARIVANGLDGADDLQFSDLGINIVAEANGGNGNDSINIVDQANAFILIARGGSGRDFLQGGNLGDTLDGGPDTDYLRGLPGPDDIIGGDGFDEVHYDNEFGRTGRVRVTLDNVSNDGNDANNEKDNVHSDVEDIYGTEGNDELSGSDASNVIYGFDGDDQITGLGGFDTLFGDGDFSSGAGNDTIFARDGLGERINCGGGSGDKVVSDDIDNPSECETNDSSPDAVLDRDADGVNKPGDCNDANPAIKPGAFDTPEDGIDQNCDGADAVILDRDKDNFNRPQDCDDNRPTVFPGADEIPGNGRDEDCNGKDAVPPVVGAGVSFNSDPVGSRTRFSRIVLTNLRKGDTIRMSCAPRRCGVKTRTFRATRDGDLSVTRRLRRALPAKAKLDFQISRPNFTTAVLRVTMRARKTPTARKLCLPAGATRPAAC